MEFTDEQKKALEKEIVDIAISALEAGTITEDQLGDMSTFVLSRIDRITNEDEKKEFLRVLAERYPFYTPLYQKELGVEVEKKEEEIVEQAESLIKQGNIDGALSVMKGEI